jgi:hypothetical protein
MARSFVLPSFPIVDTLQFRNQAGTTKFVESRLRSELPSPLYWTKYPSGRKIYWNLRLVQDYLINGPGPAHDQLIEKYLATLPGNIKK